MSAETGRSRALLSQGRELHRRGRVAEALSTYRQVLDRDPACADAAHLSALALAALGDPVAALPLLERAAAAAPSDAGVRHNLGRVRLMLGLVDAALEAFGDALRLDPSHLQAGMQRAGILERLGRAREAAEGFCAVAARHPGHVPALVGASRQLYLVDRIDEAMRWQAQAARLDPTVLDEGRIGWARAAAPALEPGALEARARASASACRVGEGVDGVDAALARELLVVDDFLPDPWEVRRRALALPYPHGGDDREVNYPGRQTAGGQADAALLQRIVDLAGVDLKWGWPGHGAFRVSPAGSMARSDIHADHDDGRAAYAAVLYLSQPSHCRGGTGFWRHRETGWERVPTEAQAAGTRWRDAASFMRRLRRDDAGAFVSWVEARRDWSLVLEVPMRFNRLVLYRSDYFHAIGEVFGAGAEDARLVQLFFFEPVAG